MVSTIDFSELYCLFYKKLFQIGYSITRDFHLAEDVVHETFIKAMKKAETIEEEKKVGAWLSAIATRTAIDFVRQEKKKKGILMEHEMLECLGKVTNQNVEEMVESSFFVGQIKNAVRKLKLEDQHLLMLKHSHGLKEREIAIVLNLKLCNVKSKIYRARKQLKLLFLEQISA